jgi:hypothetical protein
LKAISIQACQEVKNSYKWLLNGLLPFALLIGRFIAKILDLFAIPKIMDLFWQIVKFNTRSLTPMEKNEALSVFGDSINCSKVLVDEYSLIAWLGAKANRRSGMGVTIFHTINFNQKIGAAAGNSDMKWLIHELTHIAQMEHAGSQYLVEAFHAQATEGYGYTIGEKSHLRDYNREQQASIVADYYVKRSLGVSTATYEAYIAELRAGAL